MSCLISNDWIEDSEGFIASTSLVIMFKKDIAPKLGFASPIILSDFPSIENIVFKYGVGIKFLRLSTLFYDSF